MINIENLHKIYRLKDIIRYNNRVHITDESVAEHSFFVSLITLELCDKLKVSKDVTLKCLVKAILHDMPETELNDITHDVKVKLNLYEMFEKYEEEYYETHFKSFSEIMNNPDELVDLIVKYADTLSVKQFVHREYELGNRTEEILEIQANVDNRIQKLDKQIKEYTERQK